jgi:hypothetical protein
LAVPLNRIIRLYKILVKHVENQKYLIEKYTIVVNVEKPMCVKIPVGRTGISSSMYLPCI